MGKESEQNLPAIPDKVLIEPFRIVRELSLKELVEFNKEKNGEEAD